MQDPTVLSKRSRVCSKNNKGISVHIFSKDSVLPCLWTNKGDSEENSTN